MERPQLETTEQSSVSDPNPLLNTEAIPPEQPNAASPTAPVGARRTRSYAPGRTSLLFLLGAVLAAILFYAVYARPPL